MNQETLFREKEKWARLSVVIKAIGAIVCVSCFLFGGISVLDNRALIPLAVCPLFILDLYCSFKKMKLQKALEEAATEGQTISSARKQTSVPVFSIVWFAVILLVSIFIACIP
jgi:hypothetical protein